MLFLSHCSSLCVVNKSVLYSSICLMSILFTLHFCSVLHAVVSSTVTCYNTYPLFFLIAYVLILSYASYIRCVYALYIFTPMSYCRTLQLFQLQIRMLQNFPPSNGYLICLFCLVLKVISCEHSSLYKGHYT